MNFYLDSEEFKIKPSPNEIPRIMKRITKYQVNLTAKELAEELCKGKTVLFGNMKNSNISNKNLKSQQLIAVDFDNKPENTVKYTIESALNNNFIKKNALFLYKTLSHTEENHRFRVVFKLDIEQKYSEHIYQIYQSIFKLFDSKVQEQVIDKGCVNSSRLFFGGTQYIEINFKNQLNVENLVTLKSFQVEKAEINTRDIDKLPTYKLIQARSKEADREVKKRWSSLPSIRANTTAAAIEYIKKIDMAKLLGIRDKKRFNDILAEDKKPSASIFKTEDGDIYLYHKFNTDENLDIIRVVAQLRGINITNARMYLSEMMSVEYSINSEKIQSINEAIDEFRDQLLTVDLRKQFPETHKLFKDGRSNYGRDVSDILQILKNHIIEVDGEPRMISAISVRELSIRIYGDEKSYSKIQRVLQLMRYMDMIKTLDQDSIPQSILDDLLKYQKDMGYKKRTNVHELNEFGNDFLITNEQKASDYNNKKLTTSSLTRLGMQLNFGEEKAQSMFVQEVTDIREFTSKEMELIEVANIIVKKAVRNNGFIEENVLLEELKNAKVKNYKNKWRELRNDFIDGYGYERTRLNKELKKRFNVTGNYTETQSPLIIKGV